jgi:DNA-binding NarL/FixJ family response regulator
MKPIRVLLADDHAVLLEGLSRLVDDQSDMELVGVATDAGSATALVAKQQPDVAVLDLSLPNSSEAHVVEAVRNASPQTRVVVLTMHDHLGFLRRAIAAGCAGYLVKRSAGDELLTAIRVVHSGRSFIRVDLEDGDMRALVRKAPEVVSPKGLKLSGREREVLSLLARGHTNKEVGERMGLAKQTVDTYRSRLQEKIGARSRAELMRYALEHGLVEGGDASDKT